MVAGVPASERYALLTFYESTNGDNWTNNSNWLSNRPVSEWYGVTVEEGHVTKLDLMNNNLSGTIPSAIHNLHELKELELACYLLRNPSPSTVLKDRFFLSSSLSYSKDLKRGGLEGPIPPVIGLLVNLTHLSLAGNYLEGEIPSEICNLTNLELLDISRNRLSGPVPDGITKFLNLKALLISNNSFDSLPNLTALPLIYHYIWSNKFIFEDIEPNIDKLTRYTPQSLRKIGEEQSVAITEYAPYTFSIIVNGEHNQYQWYKDEVEIPEATKASYTIDELSLKDTGNYTCKITNSVVVDLTFCSKPIHLSVNKIPLIDLTALVEGYEVGVSFCSIKWNDKDADSNELISLYYDTDNIGQDGTLISENISEDEMLDEYVWDLSEVPGGEYYIYAVIDDGVNEPQVVYSQKKILVAGVPSSERDALIALYESTNGDNWRNNSNWLSDRPVNEWYRVTVENSHVIRLDLCGNDLIGTIPSELGKLSHLKRLLLYSNWLTGTIPPELGNLSNLETLSLSNTKLIGTIPPELGNLSNLRYLYLEHNQLEGQIPSTLGNLSNLNIFKIFNNNFTFEDIEPNININGIRYSPQSPVGKEQTLILDEGEAYTFTVTEGGEHNLYQWYKNDVAIPEATEPFYTVDKLLFSDSGDYTCHITNSVVTGLSLYTRPIHLSIIKILYGDANGDNILNTSDVSEILKVLSGSSIINHKAADYNQDGRVDMKDVLQLMEYLSRGGYY